MIIKWTNQALKDLDSAYEFISKENPRSAVKILNRLEELLETLSHHPEIGKVGRVDGTREIVLVGTPYLVVYMITKNIISLISFLHTSRKWPQAN